MPRIHRSFAWIDSANQCVVLFEKGKGVEIPGFNALIVWCRSRMDHWSGSLFPRSSKSDATGPPRIEHRYSSFYQLSPFSRSTKS